MTKINLTAVIIFSILASIASADFQAVRNAGFEEEGAAGSADAKYWISDSGDSGQRQQSQAYHGSWGIEVYGDATWGNVSQWLDMRDEMGDLVDMGGETVTAVVMAKYTDPNFTKEGILKIEFWGDNQKISDASNWFLTNSDPADTWKKGELTAEIPEGTQKLKVQLMNGTDGEGSVFFDTCYAYLSSAPSVYEYTNYSENHSFEIEDKNGSTDAMSWFDDEGIKGERQSSISRTGDWGMKVYDSGNWVNVTKWIDFRDDNGDLIDAGGTPLHIEGYAKYIDSGYSKTGILKAEFWGSGSKIGQADNWFLSNSDPIDTWKLGKIDTIAPPGTNKIKLQIMNGTSGNGSVYFDDVRVLVPEPLSMDFDENYLIDSEDLEEIAANWLADNYSGPEKTDQVLDDFEIYGESDPNIIDTWSPVANILGQSSLELITDSSQAYEGSQTLRWSYYPLGDGYGEYTGIMYELPSIVDISKYDEMRLRVKRHSGNSLEDSLYLRFMEPGVVRTELNDEHDMARASIQAVDGSTKFPEDEWDEWVIDLKEDLWFNSAHNANGYYSLPDMTQLGAIVIAVYNNPNDGEYMETGLIDVDKIELLDYSPTCSEDLAVDLNNDCVVNLIDYSILAEKWLLGE
ncbi:hypothetical protein [Sedimentisphaera salicampi]|uniref:hypothetical protein n=1 Tax=Sedimentisphaera salicampi TaxID=1941349 RepID=UPI000B9A4898|nr:hypothetical protein [Sedimentisphaera salicampi]OXU15308.1 hypothetical protein SMSP1_00788 [Sedimentisphaera salicampi]